MQGAPAAPAVLLRAVGLGAVGTALAVAAHGSTDGDLPGPVMLALCWTLLSALAALAARREWRLVPLLLGLALTQTALHAVFVHAATGRWTHGGSAGWLCCGQGTPTHEAIGFDDATVVQLCVRAVAVLVCAWWISRGEARAWTAARVLVRGVTRRLSALLTLLQAPLLTPQRPAFAVPTDFLPPAIFLFSSSTSRRGPPALSQR